MSLMALRGPSDFDPYFNFRLVRKKSSGSYRIHEKRGFIFVEVDLPGYIKDDIHIFVQGENLKINALSTTVLGRKISLNIELPSKAKKESFKWFYESNKLSIMFRKKEMSFGLLSGLRKIFPF